MKRLTLTLILALAGIFSMAANVKTEKLYIESQNLTQEISFYTESIVRIVKYPGKEMPAKKSYSVILEPQAVEFTRVDNGNNIVLKTSNIEVIVDKKSGKVEFRNMDGRVLAAEKEYGTSFVPCIDGPKESFKITQDFLLEKNEILYGLGQQQTGLMDQSNQELMLRNENTSCLLYTSPSPRD